MRGEPYAEPFTTGDIVGCGIHFGKQEIFFTKNGKHLGRISSYAESNLF
jgi:hypothetical protein